MAVVKADAYGHGSVEVGLAAGKSGADWLGVALLEEARINFAHMESALRFLHG